MRLSTEYPVKGQTLSAESPLTHEHLSHFYAPSAQLPASSTFERVATSSSSVGYGYLTPHALQPFQTNNYFASTLDKVVPFSVAVYKQFPTTIVLSAAPESY